MKLAALLFFIFSLHASAETYGQVSISEKNAPLEKIFKQIREQTGYIFFFDYALLDKSSKVSLEVKNATLEETLDICFENQPLTYSIVGKTVVVKSKDETPGEKKIAPLASIKGQILNENQEPLQRASVEIKGSSKGTFTDANGIFELKQVDPNAILKVSYTGYLSQEIKIDGRTYIPVKLSISLNMLDETVVIAYGTVAKRLNTGDVSTVKAADIETQPVSNPLAALEGRVPGMYITQNTGMPGGSFTVQIRGQNSIANGNEPLYIVDGVPYNSSLLPTINGALKGSSPLNFIDPSDIESIDILKDADATAIYGSRGANGVVLITTKKGKAGKMKVDLNFYAGVAKVTRKIDYLNTPQYLQMRHEAFKNDGAVPDSIVDYDLFTWDTTRYTDWQNQLIGGTANYTDAQATMSGGNSNINYVVGGGYRRESTVFPGAGADQKGSVHVGLNGTSNNQKFKYQFSGSYVGYKPNQIPVKDFVGELQYLPPNAPAVYNPDGSLNWANSTWQDGNPYAYLELKYKARTSNLVSNALLSYQLLPGLELKTSLGYSNLQMNETLTAPTTFFDPALNRTSGSASYNTISNRSWIIEPQINYQIRLGKGVLSALVGTTFQENISESQEIDATGFSSDALLENMQAATTVSVGSFKNAQYRYNAFFGRLNFNWQDKYLINLTGRRDGSSRFGPANQFANFGAIGAGWVFSKENFLQDHLSFLSFGKIRGSYGSTGNDQIGDYQFLDLYTSTAYPYQNTQGLYPTNLFNPYLSWELTKKIEGGLELGFLKDRILINTSYYHNRSDNQLVSYVLTAVTGFQSISANLPAIVQNSGWEFTLNTINVRTKNFSWSTSANLTIPKNKLIAYPNFATSPYANAYVIGQPITVRKLYHSVGVNDTTGIYQFADFKGTPTYTPSSLTDRTSLIDISPKFYGGLQNTFRYKGFTLDFLFQFVKQTGRNFLYNFIPGSRGTSQPTTVLNRWQNPGDKTNIQRYNQDLSLNDAYSNAQQSDQAFSDASFIRLKNMSLSFQLPDAWKQKVHLQNCRIYLQGQNLFTITKYKGYDPENQSNSSLPPLRVLTAGIQIIL